MTLEEWSRGQVDPAERNVYIEAWSQPGALTGSLNYYRASPLYPPIGDDPGAKAVNLDPAFKQALVELEEALVSQGLLDREDLESST